jgi:hypothetical protein
MRLNESFPLAPRPPNPLAGILRGALSSRVSFRASRKRFMQ